MTTTHAVVELLEPVRRGGTAYPAGHQFERLSVTPVTAVCRDAEGRCVRIARRVLADVKPADPPKPAPRTLAELVRAGLVKPALALAPADAT